jgi:hypothetical protein
MRKSEIVAAQEVLQDLIERAKKTLVSSILSDAKYAVKARETASAADDLRRLEDAYNILTAIK